MLRQQNKLLTDTILEIVEKNLAENTGTSLMQIWDRIDEINGEEDSWEDLLDDAKNNPINVNVPVTIVCIPEEI